MAHTDGLEWHLKTAHGYKVHAAAKDVSRSASLAVVRFQAPQVLGGPVGTNVIDDVADGRPGSSPHKLDPRDLARAQGSRGALAALIEAG
eukprot:CAMPEP_0203824830 /NCGR_PEP_ID=MMETSP0115-20131106/52706_1 /ASSEMBLY_ACC=CAM_ASM_000227 /TAXON_ID=33651 /ORGANISM="Bicosoecid sp, Strain ms1" /LENGTH=89 /DNA_ID=CAMNT_0050733875 /DNA_START=29 /DNA_END=294 /DNA_ORIENTATION=-